jgi:DNA polymerase elongation subunit (family B)
MNGAYYADAMGRVGELIKQWYGDRVVYKKAGDRREYTIKIIINTMYGILDNPYYNLVFDKIGSGDVTRIGRQWIHYARKIFREHGYKVLYTDTDSIYILDPFKDKIKVNATCKLMEDNILSTVPFPLETFKFKIDDEIKYMYFFKGGEKEKQHPENEFFEDEDDFINKPLGFMKKNYIYVTKDNRVVIKNLGIRKKDKSPLGKKIFWDYLVPEIKKGTIKFSKVYIKELINKLLDEDMSLAMLRRNVGNAEQYKSQTSIQVQIANKYGAGIHFLIPNKNGIGVGKGKSFCTLDEFNKHKLRIHDIDLTNVWKELDYFIKIPKTVNIFDFVKKEDEDKILTGN